MDTLTAMGIQQWRKRDLVFVEDELGVEASPVEAVNVCLEVDALAIPKIGGTEPVNAVAELAVETEKTKQEPEIASVQAQEVVAKDIAPNDTVTENSTWADLEELLLGGILCPSCYSGGSTLGQGDRQADWLFISDAPNNEEITYQQLFLGRNGELFEAILKALNLDRQGIYLTSFFKCPPSNDDNFLVASCDSILDQQIRLIKPKVIVTLGEFAAQSVLKRNDSLQALQEMENTLKVKPSKAIDNALDAAPITVVPINQIKELLDEPKLKALVWKDLSQALQKLFL